MVVDDRNDTADPIIKVVLQHDHTELILADPSPGAVLYRREKWLMIDGNVIRGNQCLIIDWVEPKGRKDLVRSTNLPQVARSA